MAIEQLIALIRPPRGPIDGDGDWTVAETQFGVQFPADFKEMTRRYGTGCFYSDLYIINPLTRWGRERVNERLDIYRELRDACEFSLLLHPEPSGLLPWGHDSNGNGFFWLVEGEPDQWPVVQIAHEAEETPFRRDVNITTFLVEFVQNRYPEMLGGVKFKKRHFRFTPGLPWARG